MFKKIILGILVLASISFARTNKEIIDAGNERQKVIFDKNFNSSKDKTAVANSTYTEVLDRDLKGMDMAAIALAKSNNLKLKIVSLFKDWAILRAVKGDDEGTTIC